MCKHEGEKLKQIATEETPPVQSNELNTIEINTYSLRLNKARIEK